MLASRAVTDQLGLLVRQLEAVPGRTTTGMSEDASARSIAAWRN